MATKNSERDIAPSGFQPNLRVIPGTNGGGDVAEYIQPSRSGLESGFYVEDRGLPWHVTLARRLNLPELMKGSATTLGVQDALDLAVLRWKALKTPMLVEIPGVKGLVNTGKFATYRDDTGAILGTNLSPSYTVVQNEDAFEFGDALLEAGATIESAGSLFGGRAVFVSFEVPDHIQVAGDPSEYRLFLLISNGHDGDHRFRVTITIERALCRNTVRIAERDRAISQWSIRHTSGVDGRVQAAREALGISFKYAEAFAETASALVQKSLVDRQVDKILSDLFPMTEAQIVKVEKDASAIDKTTFGQVREVYRTSPSIDPIRGTAYGVLNAVTEYLDHVKKYGDVALGSGDENRAERLLFSPPDQDVKQRAIAVLTKTK